MKNNTATQSNSTTQTSEKARQKQANSARLAKVATLKKKASAYREERDFYYGIVTELLAPLGEAVEFLQAAEKDAPALKALVARITSQQHHSVKQLLRYWPQNTESQSKISALLDADGLGNLLEDTADGYVSLSSDLILENAARIIEATKKE